MVVPAQLPGLEDDERRQESSLRAANPTIATMPSAMSGAATSTIKNSQLTTPPPKLPLPVQAFRTVPIRAAVAAVPDGSSSTRVARRRR